MIYLQILHSVIQMCMLRNFFASLTGELLIFIHSTSECVQTSDGVFIENPFSKLPHKFFNANTLKESKQWHRTFYVLFSKVHWNTILRYLNVSLQ